MVDSPRRGAPGPSSAPTPAEHPLPRRSATSPSSWDDWNADEDDMPVVPSRSARLIDSVPPPLPAMPKRGPAAPMGRRAILGEEPPREAVNAVPRRSATSPSQWLAWEAEDDIDEPTPAQRTEREVTVLEGIPREERTRPTWMWPVVIVVLIALVAAAIIFGLNSLL